MIGLSWLGELLIVNLPSLATSQAQPLPNRVIAALLNASWNLAKLSNELSIALPSAPSGSPPPSLDIIIQNQLWLRCPPPLFRTAVRAFSGTLSSPVSSSVSDSFC